MSSDGNQTTSTLSITLGRADSGRYLSCRAYNHILQSEPLEDGWRLDIQCEFFIDIYFIIILQITMHVRIHFMLMLIIACTTSGGMVAQYVYFHQINS